MIFRLERRAVMALDKLRRVRRPRCGKGVVFCSAFVFVAGLAHALDPRDLYASRVESVVLVGTENGWGTGSVVAPGMVLTNEHVVRGSDRIQIALHRENPDWEGGRIEKSRQARVLSLASGLDLALLAVDLPPGLPGIPLGNSDDVEIGAPVYAIGHPAGGGLWSLTQGGIGSRRRDLGGIGPDVFQTDAAINPGNSGGPLLDEHGAMIGINVLKAVGEEFEGLGFAIQANVACAWMLSNGVRGVECPVASEAIRLPSGTARSRQRAFLAEVRASDGLQTVPRPLDRDALLRSLREQQAEAFESFAREQAEAFGEFDR